MISDYDGVVFYQGENCSENILEKAYHSIEVFDSDAKTISVNQAIEMYNIFLIISSDSKLSLNVLEKESLIKKLCKIYSVYFSNICDVNFISEYHMVWRQYIKFFWLLFEKNEVYERVSASAFSQLLNDNEFNLQYILACKKTVKHYDDVIGSFMRTSIQSAEIIITKFFEKTSPGVCAYDIPKSLDPSEYETILDKYVQSEKPRTNYLQLISISQSSKECPITPKLGLSAKRRMKEILSQKTASETIRFGVGVSFDDISSLVEFDLSSPYEYHITYDEKLVKNENDYLRLLTYFISPFSFVDKYGRCTFTSIKSEQGLYEAFLGCKGIKEYVIGTAFKIREMRTSAAISGYMHTLEKYGKPLENVLSWFFSEYIKKEFGIDGFVTNFPSNNLPLLSKCKELPQEMEGVLKQFKMLVEDGTIDRELYEYSSKHTIIRDVPSMIKEKYAYSNSEAISREMFDLFSNQSIFSYLPQYGLYSCLFDLLTENSVCYTDYPEWNRNEIDWLITRGVLDKGENERISVNSERAFLLKELYEYEVICPFSLIHKEEYDKLVESGELRIESTLFSIPEQNYINFMLNKSEYSNGFDLDNKYSHSTYPLDVKQQENDYISLMKILVLYVLKIYQELCLTKHKFK